MNDILKIAESNPALAGAATLIALVYVFKVVFEFQRHRSHRDNDTAVLENLQAQTAALNALVESNTRQEGAIRAQTASITGMTTNLAVAMDRQQTAARTIESIRDALPGVCHQKK